MYNKVFLILSFFIVFVSSVRSQTCITDYTKLTTQSEIDNFETTYPGCTTVLNDLVISGTEIANLNGLSNITVFRKNLKIDTCPQLTSLLGLNQVDSIYGGFYIRKNDNLSSLNGINNLKTVEGELKILYNNSLDSVTDLSSLNNIGYNLEIIGNTNLENLNGFQGVSTLNHSLYLGANNSLTSVTGLNNIQNIGDLLIIIQNPMLADITGLASLETIGDSLVLVNNPLLASLTGLNNVTSIGKKVQIEQCGITNLQGLNKLAAIHDSLILFQNPNLQSLDGLSSLTSIDVFKIKENSSLLSLDGLTSLETIGDLIISYNHELASLSGLKNVTNFNGDVLLIYNKIEDLSGFENASVINGDLGINYNSNLKTMNGLDNLETINGFLSFSWNDSLIDITAFSNLDSVNGGFVYIDGNKELESLNGLENMFFIEGSSIDILNNPKLTFCGIPSICYHQVYANLFLAENNGPGCSSNNEVENACGGPVIQGTIHSDTNSNCLTDINEIPLANWLVRAIGNNDTIIDFTDDFGFYKLFVPGAGTYEVTSFPPDYWIETCTGTVTINIDNNQDVATIHFFGEEETSCPLLTIDITAPIAIPCQATYFKVNYCNNGTAVANNTQVTIKFNNDVSVTSAMQAGAMLGYTNLGDNTYHFELFDALIGHCQEFTVFATLDCAVIEGQAICAYANITSDENCTPVNPSWSHASVKLTGSCTNDNVSFTIENIGEGSMSLEKDYILMADDIIIDDWVLTRSQVKLDPGAAVAFNIPKNGKTYALFGSQEKYHPGKSHPLVVVEGCGTNTSGSFSTGYTLQLPEDDADAFISIDCQEIRLGLPTTNQQNFPVGYADEHYINKDQEIEYKINFQNISQDTLRNMVIKEVISKHLDITSLQLGASSHPYGLKITGDTLFLKMASLLIPPKDSNEVASHGFIKFRINQKPDLPNGTRIENTAFLYYGATDAVETNTVFNTIGKAFIIVDILDPNNKHLKLNANPNPFYSKTTFQVEGISFKTAEFFLFDQQGKLVRKEQFSNDSFQLKKDHLPQGTYSFEILFDNKTKANGRITIL